MKTPTMNDTVARLQREAEDAAGLEPLPEFEVLGDVELKGAEALEAERQIKQADGERPPTPGSYKAAPLPIEIEEGI